jgi:hypothetical protein
MVSGQGADKFLSWYRRYQDEQIILNMSSFTKSALSAIGSVLPSTTSERIIRFTLDLKN